jgi:hypothetical protein
MAKANPTYTIDAAASEKLVTPKDRMRFTDSDAKIANMKLDYGETVDEHYAVQVGASGFVEEFFGDQ